MSDDQDTLRPPPPIDIASANLEEKIDFICNMVVDISNNQVALHQNMVVLNARLGIVDGEDGQPSMFDDVRFLKKRYEELALAVKGMSHDVELMREHLLGKGANIYELRDADARRRSKAPPDNSGG